MNNKVLFGMYLPGNSLMHRLDPRLKLVGCFWFVILVFFARTWWTNLLLIGALGLVIWLSQVKYSVYGGNSGPVLQWGTSLLALGLAGRNVSGSGPSRFFGFAVLFNYYQFDGRYGHHHPVATGGCFRSINEALEVFAGSRQSIGDDGVNCAAVCAHDYG